MKKIILIAIAALMTLSMVSCGNVYIGTQPDEEQTTTTWAPITTVPSTQAPAAQYTPDNNVYYNIGDTVTFGSYEQNNRTNDGAEPIEWIILDRNGDNYLLISRYGLDCQSYNNVSEYVTWDMCSLRNWLNGSFYNTAFNSSEKAKRCAYTSYSSYDMVFCLSGYEAQKYFPDAASRRADATPYAISKGAYTSNDFCGWWLRGRGERFDVAARVNIKGEILTSDSQSEGGVERIDYAVRPAIWVAL